MGKHPLLVMLRDQGTDSRTAELRHQTLGAVITYMADKIAQQGGWKDPTAEDVSRARVRAGLLFSTFAGIVTLREAIPGDPFSQAEPETLRVELTRIATEIIIGGPPGVSAGDLAKGQVIS
ncbi:hypothetical protein [Kineosporia sp. NBRC 101731]|uniref:hypothetical protein n=1 Tax=Kineosporia sp. NBRC 101731 TaxID=3032199 RepID=UPI0024A025B0|nr:hypothetical protein [Kineosporia sp. NBRC 101731]GLY28197.1 hypothetical protein Kisp02_15620 [Kineosporia sp. NBRC 101731]